VKIFAVHFLSGAQQRGSLSCVFSIAHGKQKMLGKKLFVVRFYISARQQIVCRVFFGWRTALFFSHTPLHLLPYTSSLSCAIEKRMAKI
jgi:hypothetical protein